METIRSSTTLQQQLEFINNHFPDADNINLEDIDAILVKNVKKSATGESNGSNVQINKNDIEGFFPYLENNTNFPHTRIELPAIVTQENIIDIPTEELTEDSTITLRSTIRNSYPYIQLACTGALQELKRNWKENDVVIFIRKADGTFEIFAYRGQNGNISTEQLTYSDALPRERVAGTTYSTTNENDENAESFDFYNKIFFGPPGTGKSYDIDELTRSQHSITTTFHPSYDHNQFYGFFKPITVVNEANESNIEYHFSPRTFLEAYIKAWRHQEEGTTVFLRIEEINRGNCAEIFGTLFQLLDRDTEGFSKYFINIDQDASLYLRTQLEETPYPDRIKELFLQKRSLALESPYSVMLIPNNLRIVASMNTSDQSLFPMDSAFKRRWDWEYVPIDLADAELFQIEIGNKRYSWRSFLERINAKIKSITQSEDKQLGNRFVNPTDGIINRKTLINKIFFYLWSEIYKDEDPEDDGYIFSYLLDENDQEPKLVSFNELPPLSDLKIQKILEFNEITEIS